MFPKLLLAGVIGVLWIILCRHLSAEWSYNEQYNYGWFVPFFALYLFWLRWEDAPPPAPVANKRAATIGYLVALGVVTFLWPLRLIEVANPDWRPIGWTHALIVVGATLIIIWQAGGRPWVRHFAFPVTFILVAVPWPSFIEEPIIQRLMPIIAGIAGETLSLSGIPAQLQGNLIRIGDGVVGVNEACSGVRSLQTSMMIGLLFGELKRLSVAGRTALVAGAIAVAFVANCGRAFFLVWIAATRGVDQVDRYHNTAGYAIVVLVFLGCVGLTKLLAGKQSSVPAAPSANANVRSLPFPSGSFLIGVLCVLLVIEASVEMWYRLHETHLAPSAQWTVQFPEASSQFRDIKIDELTKRVLRFDQGRGATWREADSGHNDIAPRAFATQRLLYFFRWKPGHNSALLANAHRPDVCLPSTGWRQIADLGVRNYPVGDSLSIPFRHFRFSNTTNGNTHFADAFYCVWEDRVRTDSPTQTVLENPSAWSRSERLEAVLEGRRHLGSK